VKSAPELYSAKRTNLGFDEVNYGVGGIKLFELAELENGQIGYSVKADGQSLTGRGPGDWREDWLVIGYETALGDPVFLSTQPPHPVFTAFHGQGTWTPDLIAPSVERFWDCLDAFRRFAHRRGSPAELELNPPEEQEIEDYLSEVLHLCDGNVDTVVFWSVQAQIGMNAEDS